MNKYYIAYGSNLNIEQMAQRCNTAKLLCTGFIEDWTLRFRLLNGPAYATILPETGAKVPVAIWEIDNLCEQALDIYEDFPQMYDKKEIEAISSDGNLFTGMVYIMNETCIPGIPSEQYVQSISQGYADNNLDLDYLNQFLKTI